MLNSTASLIETKGTNSQCPNESENGEKEIDGNTSQKNLSQVALPRHALKTKRVELVVIMSAFIVQGNSGKTYSSQKKDATVHQQQHVGILLQQK